MHFIQKLLETIAGKDSLLCIGLDTDLGRIPHFLRHSESPLFAFNKAIIDGTADFAAAYKVNTAFYEAHGIEGWSALEQTFRYLPENVIKIADAKRGDIGNTSRLYARAFFEALAADAITVNPLMGFDSVSPFLQRPEKGVFFLCLTSNPGSLDLQHFFDGQKKLYQRIAELVQGWNQNNNCGLVVGATHPGELAQVRTIAQELPFLIPGIGAQGGDLEEAVINGTDHLGTNALYNSSRDILYASEKEDFVLTAANRARSTQEALNRAKQKKLNNARSSDEPR